MALDLVAQDIIIDETTGLQDNDVNPSLPPHSTNTTLSYLLGLDGPGGLASPEVAFKANFVQATASAGETITSVTLSQNLAGNAFSTTVGVNSGIRTVDGNYVWLFQDATHANVVIGVIGTSDPAAAPAATGPLAFSFALLNTSNTNADLYTVQYVPLLHPDATNPDDRIDLTDKVFASVAGTSVANFSGQNAPPGINQFYLLDSSNDASKQILVTGFLGTANATPNVSTQGFGVDNQSINPTETLQVDFVTGGTLHAGSASQIQYSSHLETITQAGFTINQITPSNPNLRVDIKISAFNVQGNEQGLNFYDGSPTTTAPITSLKLTGQSGFASPITANGTYATGSGNVTVSGLGTNVVTITGLDNITTVDVTTGSPMDRLTVTGVDANEGCDITEFHFTTQTSNAYTEQVGSFINFDDDGPSISTTGTEPTLTVDETVLATDDTKSFAANFSPAFGADGAGAVTYALSAIAGPSGLVDTATNQAVNLSLNGSVVEGRTAVGNDLVFTVSVDASGNVTLDQKRAVVHANANDANDAATLAADNLVQLTATVTDKDGDHQAATLNIGQNLSFLDDGPSISTTGMEPTLTVDETVFTTDDTKSFAANFSPAFGADGAGAVTYALSVVAGPSGLVDTATNQAVNLSLNGSVVEGRTAVGNDLVFTVSVDASGNVTLDQKRAVVHADPNDANDAATLAADNLVTLTATVTDKDGDHQAATLNIGQNLSFLDDGPSISTTGTEPTLTVDETVFTTDDTKSFAANFSPAFGADGAGAVTYALSVVAGPSGLVDTATNQAVNLSLNGSVVEGRTAVGNDLVFTVSVDASGNVTLDQRRAVVHANANDPNDAATLAADNLVQLTATVIDKDGDHQAATLNIGQNLSFLDDGPTITAQFDADPATPGIQTPEHLGNAVGQTATGTFGYDIGHDSHPATFYDATHSDFVDTNPAVPGIQIGLTGTVDNTQNPNITQAVATLTSESATSATFNFSFHYDKDPLTAGVQDSTAGGTLVFDKVAGTYTFTLTDVIDGFSFDVLHTSELVSKQPTGNTGHPLIVAEQLTPNGDPDPFFVQFTGNSVTQQIGFGFNSTGDGAPSGPPTDVSFTQGAHELVTNVNEDWVSATQSTNGVAGDTIQKGELLTMRFFKENILSDVDPSAPGGGTERLDPTTSASGVVIKFDGIGSSEDLILILDLKNAAGNEITRAVNVQNSDLIKGNANIPAPYNTEFTLDNNDALLIIEQNDYTVAGETYQIQGIQIMQSANGLTGNAIDLNGATGANGGSSATSNLTAWDPTDNDVLKITDIGFVQQTSGTINANLDFSLALVDADGDATATQHINVNISNAFIV
ncbi:conserved hypothetical protein [Methylobacterium sp. 4-46]|uniref:DUF5801 repeats-in-toxin domain-containing protein n=1 Tax=Methylobacterium sp. (strain 4-46) TaxID=426117 RepID=UPI000152E433|nr:DUF5801 repeats-in-toxin domain-containing protein [Methylobacterium sp. 4-46]ACA16964.1 conserved hypothetical protein [Methylobacterium sp. 4-46]